MILLDALDNDERAQEFRKDRLDKIDSKEVWNPMSNGPYCVVHWLPISKGALLKPDNLKSMDVSEFIKMERARRDMWVERINLDGVRFFWNRGDEVIEESVPNDAKSIRRYFWNAQIFHSGALEIACALSFRVDSEKVKWLYSADVIEEVWKLLDGLKNGFEKYIPPFDVTTRIIVGISLLRVKNYRFPSSSHTPSDRDKIIMPGMLIENLQEVQNMEDIERPIFDMLWRSFGLPECDHYDENGRRIVSNVR